MHWHNSCICEIICIRFSEYVNIYEYYFIYLLLSIIIEKCLNCGLQIARKCIFDSINNRLFLDLKRCVS